MKILPFVATLCIALYSSAAVAKNCDPEKPDDVVRTLALNMYHEARGQGVAGMQMVGEVTLNRVASVEYPDNVCEVVYQRSQFAWTRKKDINPREQAQWNLALYISERLLNGDIERFNNGATHFYNPDNEKKPRWARKFEKVAIVGDHVFYDDGSYKLSYMYPGVLPITGRAL